MGRKIPGRKHHGVRDPDKQRMERLKRVKDKINAPPANPDEQQIPKSLQRLAELQAKVKNGDFARKAKKKRLQPPERFQQYADESNREFLLRVQKECDAVKREAAFEQKYGVEIRKSEQGEVQDVVKRKDPLQDLLKQARKKKKTKGQDNGPRLSKSQKRSLKLAEKKKKKRENKVDEFEKFQDTVKFGEQVHAPPTLTLPKKVKITDATPRPGKKDLLLKSMLSLNKTNNNAIDRTGKRKDLPNALRRQLDRQQQEVVQAYRLLKEKKYDI